MNDNTYLPNKLYKSVPIYNKLVRDKIPEILENKGLKYKTKILDEIDYKKYLRIKLDEEISELDQATTNQEKLEELSDILELLFAMTKQLSFNHDHLINKTNSKRKNRGGFEDKIFLIEVED